jgi:hypothetical protein
MTKTLNQIFFFLHQNQNIFSVTLEIRIFLFWKKNITPAPWKLNGPSLKYITSFASPRINIFNIASSSWLCFSDQTITLHIIIEGVLFKCRKQLHGRIIAPRGEVWEHKACITPPHFIEVTIPSHENEWSCIYVSGYCQIYIALHSNKEMAVLSPLWRKDDQLKEKYPNFSILIWLVALKDNIKM